MGKVQYCEVDLKEEKYQAFVYAVKNHYWYQMYIDDLPIWGEFSQLSTRTTRILKRRELPPSVKRETFGQSLTMSLST